MVSDEKYVAYHDSLDLKSAIPYSLLFWECHTLGLCSTSLLLCLGVSQDALLFLDGSPRVVLCLDRSESAITYSPWSQKCHTMFSWISECHFMLCWVSKCHIVLGGVSECHIILEWVSKYAGMLGLSSVPFSVSRSQTFLFNKNYSEKTNTYT